MLTSANSTVDWKGLSSFCEVFRLKISLADSASGKTKILFFATAEKAEAFAKNSSVIKGPEKILAKKDLSTSKLYVQNQEGQAEEIVLTA